MGFEADQRLTSDAAGADVMRIILERRDAQLVVSVRQPRFDAIPGRTRM